MFWKKMNVKEPVPRDFFSILIYRFVNLVLMVVKFVNLHNIVNYAKKIIFCIRYLSFFIKDVRTDFMLIVFLEYVESVT